MLDDEIPFHSGAQVREIPIESPSKNDISPVPFILFTYICTNAIHPHLELRKFYMFIPCSCQEPSQVIYVGNETFIPTQCQESEAPVLKRREDSRFGKIKAPQRYLKGSTLEYCQSFATS